MPVDPVTLNIVGTALAAIPREMAANLRRAAFSSVVREARDFAVALVDPRGNVVSQAEAIPIMAAGISHAIAAVLAEIDPASLTDDDAILYNDPFRGGQHLQDIYLFTPIFHQGRLAGFGASVAHHVDIGGGEPGLTVNAKEIFQEGLRLPGRPFSVSRDWHGGFVEQLFRLNVRVPDLVVGDLNAQFAASNVAAERLRELVTRHGFELTAAVMDELQNYAERRLRDSIAEIPDGDYTAEEIIDASTWGGDRHHVRVAVRVRGSDLEVDFAGTDPQVPANVNCPFASTVSSVQSAIRGLLRDKDIPFNEGCNRPITVTAPYGSILNPAAPAAVRARLTPASRAFDAVIRALAEALPDRVVATGYDTTSAAALSYLDPDNHEYAVVMEVLGGGWGAGPAGDGADGLDNPISNCSSAPVEALEIDYSHFRVTEFALLPGSGGDGRTRGGLGFVRTYEATRDGVTFSAYSDRHRYGARGLFGGEEGATGGLEVTRSDGTVQRLSHIDAVTLAAGERVSLRTGGGGGYGSPAERPHAHREADLRDGLTTKETPR